MQDAYGLLISNLLSPIVIAFLIGMAATLVRSELEWGIFATILHGVIGVLVGRVSGLGIGGSVELRAITASASYIDAPAAVRATLPNANPGTYLASSLGITFPFNPIFGLPTYYGFASWLFSRT